MSCIYPFRLLAAFIQIIKSWQNFRDLSLKGDQTLLKTQLPLTWHFFFPFPWESHDLEKRMGRGECECSSLVESTFDGTGRWFFFSGHRHVHMQAHMHACACGACPGSLPREVWGRPQLSLQWELALAPSSLPSTLLGSGAALPTLTTQWCETND